MTPQQVPPVLLKTWLDIYSMHELHKLQPSFKEKMVSIYGSVDAAEQHYINYLHQRNNIEWIKVA